MLDYLSRVNELPLCSDYADLRKLKLAEPIFSSSVIVLDLLDKRLKIKEQAIAHAIPEFMRFNLVEGDIRNVF